MRLLLLSCWIIAGIAAEDPTLWHYGVKNSSLCLQFGKSPTYQNASLNLSFNKTVIIRNNKATPIFKNKVDYNPRKQFLCINKLTEADSGIYTADIYSEADFKVSVEHHRLVVEEHVPRPVIKMSTQHSNLSAGLCNITVKCSVKEDCLWSVCDTDSCRPSQRSFREVNITIILDNRAVVCSGSNHVSTSNVSKSIEGMCFNISNPEHEEKSKTPTVIIIVIVVCLSLFVFIIFVAKVLSSKEKNHHQAGTSTAQLVQNQPVESQPQPVLRMSTSSGQSEASYENVDATQPSQTSRPTISPRGQLGSVQSQVDTVYSVLENVPAPLGKSDSADVKGHTKTQEASPSQSATLDEAGRSAQINTVYSVLRKPKDLSTQHRQ